MQQINENKVNVVEFKELRMSLEKERAMRLYKDMESLFNTTVSSMKATMQSDKESFEKLIKRLQKYNED